MPELRRVRNAVQRDQDLERATAELQPGSQSTQRQIWRTSRMASIDPLLRRHKHFATTGAHKGASIVAKHQVLVITCLDPRTDPSAFLELELGDAMVIRNAGGRVSPDVLTDLAYIGYLSEVVTPAGPRFEVAVIHHTDCGT